MIIGPDDPRAITDPDELARLRAYTERFNRDVLGLKPMSAKDKKKKHETEEAILDLIGWDAKVWWVRSSYSGRRPVVRHLDPGCSTFTRLDEDTKCGPPREATSGEVLAARPCSVCA